MNAAGHRRTVTTQDGRRLVVQLKAARRELITCPDEETRARVADVEQALAALATWAETFLRDDTAPMQATAGDTRPVECAS